MWYQRWTELFKLCKKAIDEINVFFLQTLVIQSFTCSNKLWAYYFHTLVLYIWMVFLTSPLRLQNARDIKRRSTRFFGNVMSEENQVDCMKLHTHNTLQPLHWKISRRRDSSNHSHDQHRNKDNLYGFTWVWAQQLTVKNWRGPGDITSIIPY